MKYKLLVIDVDGTLLNDQKEITAQTRSAIMKAQQMGVHIVLSSGRPTGGILPIARSLELNNYGGYVISYNGAQIIDMATESALFDKRLDPSLFPYLDKKAKKNNFAIFTYIGENILTDHPENPHVIHEADLNNMHIKGVPNFPEAVDFAPCKCILASDDEEALIGLENHWKRRLAGAAEVFRSEDYFLEVVPPTVDKGNTLALLMDMWRRSGRRADDAVGRLGGGHGQCAGFGESLYGPYDAHQRAGRCGRSDRNGYLVGDPSGRDSVRPAQRAGETCLDGELGHPIYIRFRRPCGSNDASRRAHAPAFRHPAWRRDLGLGRNRSGIRFDAFGKAG